MSEVAPHVRAWDDVVHNDAEMEPGLRVTGQRVRDLRPGRVGSRVKALTRLFDPESCLML